jgi:hypothetical protein
MAGLLGRYQKTTSKGRLKKMPGGDTRVTNRLLLILKLQPAHAEAARVTLAMLRVDGSIFRPSTRCTGHASCMLQRNKMSAQSQPRQGRLHG